MRPGNYRWWKGYYSQKLMFKGLSLAPCRTWTRHIRTPFIIRSEVDVSCVMYLIQPGHMGDKNKTHETYTSERMINCVINFHLVRAVRGLPDACYLASFPIESRPSFPAAWRPARCRSGPLPRGSPGSAAGWTWGCRWGCAPAPGWSSRRRGPGTRTTTRKCCWNEVRTSNNKCQISQRLSTHFRDKMNYTVGFVNCFWKF